mmetsp:Transcript_31518/g.52654  ORF Transcript_31518/g.52654 Transcript_31518/m.52654 type:complete len:811 (+) Transcript_31518:84-2516(+)
MGGETRRRIDCVDARTLPRWFILRWLVLPVLVFCNWYLYNYQIWIAHPWDLAEVNRRFTVVTNNLPGMQYMSFGGKKSDNSCQEVDGIDTAILYLKKPAHSFHGDHWYHIGEHYISRHMEIQSLLEIPITDTILSDCRSRDGNASSERMHNERDQSQQGSIRRFKHIKVIAEDEKLAIMMSRFSFSLVVLACYHSELESVELFGPTKSRQWPSSSSTGTGICRGYSHQKENDSELGAQNRLRAVHNTAYNCSNDVMASVGQKICLPPSAWTGTTVNSHQHPKMKRQSSVPKPLFAYYRNLSVPERFMNFSVVYPVNTREFKGSRNKLWYVLHNPLTVAHRLALYLRHDLHALVTTGKVSNKKWDYTSAGIETDVTTSGSWSDSSHKSSLRTNIFSSSFSSTSSSSVCGTYVGSIGFRPVSTDKWFTSKTHAREFQQHANDICANTTTSTSSSSSSPVISLQNTKLKQPRNEAGMTGTIQQHRTEDDEKNQRSVPSTTGRSINTMLESAHRSASSSPSGGSVAAKATTIMPEHDIIRVPTSRVFNVMIYQRDVDRRFVNLTRILETIQKHNQQQFRNPFLCSGQQQATVPAAGIPTAAEAFIPTDEERHPAGSSIADRYCYNHWNVTVFVHDEFISPCAFYEAMNRVDLFVTAHGFQCTALMFLPKGATLFEIFPYKYFKKTYIALSESFGVEHRMIQNPSPRKRAQQQKLAPVTTKEGETAGADVDTTQGELNSYLPIAGTLTESLLPVAPTSLKQLEGISLGACMRDAKCRSYARSRDIYMPPSHLRLLRNIMTHMENHRRCARNTCAL